MNHIFFGFELYNSNGDTNENSKVTQDAQNVEKEIL